MNTNGEEQEVKKKKKIIAVYNTHNSKTGIKDPRAEKKQQAARQAQSRPAAAKPAARPQRLRQHRHRLRRPRQRKPAAAPAAKPSRRDREARGSVPEPSGSIRERKQTGRPGETDTES